MKRALIRLLGVRSIVTILMTAVLVVLLVAPVNPPREIVTLYSTSYGAVMTYFFTKKDKEDNDETVHERDKR